MIMTAFLVAAVICWLLAGLKIPELSRISWGWFGFFCFGLSLLWPHIQ